MSGRHGARNRTSLWRGYSLPILLLLFSTSLALFSISSFVSLPRQLSISQQCRMSRMWPAYIDHTENVQAFSPSGLYKKYRLYLYRERNFDPMDLPSGSPAVFVPGNAGSYGQIRSVASSAARQFYKEGGDGTRKDEWKNAPVATSHTDWYTVDFNEDFSAFSGSTLIEQATFLNEVLAYIRDRYASPGDRHYAPGERNTSVPILAHSMGGIAARLMSKLHNYAPGSVDTIVTLSTPHAYPPVPFDKSMEHVYSQINEPIDPQDPSVPPILVSIAGGLLDTQLPSDPSSLSLARVGEAVPASRLSAFTSSLPSLWSSVDHLAVMWCDQLREKIARAFLLDTMAFGRITEERSAGGLLGPKSQLRKRRELWRRALGLYNEVDAGNGDSGPLEILSNPDELFDEDREAIVVEGESRFSPAEVTGPNSILQTNATVAIYKLPADPSSAAFEVITNLCVGGNPSSGMGSPIPQPVEVVAMVCTSGTDPKNPSGGLGASCQTLLPWQWELIPHSILPRTDLMQQEPQNLAPTLPEARPFPDADEVYHVPGVSFQRLRLDSATLRRKRIDFIRVERKTDRGLYVSAHGLKSFLRAGWIQESGAVVQRHATTFDLIPQLSAEQADSRASTTLAFEWSLRHAGSALLARHVTVYPSQCFIDHLKTYTLISNDPVQRDSDPAFMPFMHVSHRATGDSRWHPQILSASVVHSIRTGKYAGQPVTLPLSLHGSAPYMPPPRRSLDEIKIQLWSDPALLGYSPSMGSAVPCTAPIEKIRVAVDWRASAGLVLIRYRFLLAAWPLAILVACLAYTWHDWMVGWHPIFPSPLNSILRPPRIDIKFISKLDPLAGFLVVVAGTLIAVDYFRLIAYRVFVEPNDHGPSSSSLGMFLGLHDARLSMVLIPCFLVVSYAALLLIVLIVQALIAVSTITLLRLGLASRFSWGLSSAQRTAAGPPHWKKRSLMGIAGLLVSVMLVIPHQFVFLCIFLLQLLNTLRSSVDLRVSTKTSSSSGGSYSEIPRSASPKPNDAGGGASANPTSRSDAANLTQHEFNKARYHQHLSVLLVLLLLLPQKASFLVTWTRNLLSVGILAPKTSASWWDHNPLDVAPLLILVWIFAGGRMLECPRTGLEVKLVTVGFGVVAAYGFVYGIRYTYCIYDSFNALAALLTLCHWMARQFGPGKMQHEQTRAKGLSQRMEERVVAAEEFELLQQEEEENRTASGGGTSRKTAHLPIHHLALPASVTNAGREAATTTTSISSISSTNASTQKPPLPQTSNSIDHPQFKDLLDLKIAEYLTLLHRYQKIRQSSTQKFVEGYLKLSKAKMEFGHTRIGPNSYDERLLAEVKARIEVVTPKGEAGNEEYEVTVTRVKPDYSHLLPKNDDDDDDHDHDEEEEGGKGELVPKSTDHASGEYPTGLRRRVKVATADKDAESRGGERADAANEDSTDNEKDLKKKVNQSIPSTSSPSAVQPQQPKKKAVAMPDALLQFVGLPSTSLRGAQKDFKQALDTCLGIHPPPPKEGMVERGMEMGLLQLTIQLSRLEADIRALKHSRQSGPQSRSSA